MKGYLLRSASWLLLLCVVLTGCKKPPKKKREEIVVESSREQRRINNFTNALRKVVEWRQTQPVADSEAARTNLIKAVVKKFDQIPMDDLPNDLGKAWKRMMRAWKALAKDSPADKDLIDEGTAAAAELNRLLAECGYPDLRL